MKPHIRRIHADEGPRLRAFRLRGLADAPTAYGSTLAVEQHFADDIWRERAAGASAGCDRATFIAEHEGLWVGLVTGLARRDDSGNAGPMLVSMFVEPTARRAGVGLALIESVCAWARSCGTDHITLWVGCGNDPALALYQKCGFRPTGATQPLEHTPSLTERQMIRDLR